MSRRKNYAITSRIAAASPVSTHRNRRSGSRDSGGRASARPPLVTVPVALSGAAGRLPRALPAVAPGLRLLVKLGRQLRVLQLARDVLALALGVVQPRLQALGAVGVLARL